MLRLSEQPDPHHPHVRVITTAHAMRIRGRRVLLSLLGALALGYLLPGSLPLGRILGWLVGLV